MLDFRSNEKESSVSKEGLFRQKGMLTILEAEELEGYLKTLKPDNKKGRIFIVIEDNALAKSSAFIFRPNTVER